MPMRRSGKRLLPVRRWNRKRHVTIAAARGMAIGSTYVARKNIRKHTSRHPRGDACSQINHVLIDGRHLSDLMDVRTYSYSDHYLEFGRGYLLRFIIQRLLTGGVVAQYCQQLDEHLGRISFCFWRCQQPVGPYPQSCENNGTRSDWY